MAVRAEPRREAIGRVRRNILEETSPAFFRRRATCGQPWGGAAVEEISQRRRTEEGIRPLEFRDLVQRGRRWHSALRVPLNRAGRLRFQRGLPAIQLEDKFSSDRVVIQRWRIERRRNASPHGYRLGQR